MLFFLTYVHNLPNIYKKAFIFGPLVPFMVGFHLTASDTWAHAQGCMGGARGQNLAGTFQFFSSIESFVFVQQVLFCADFFSATILLSISLNMCFGCSKETSQ